MLRELNPPEASRTYLWPDGQTIKILNVNLIFQPEAREFHADQIGDRRN